MPPTLLGLQIEMTNNLPLHPCPPSGPPFPLSTGVGMLRVREGAGLQVCLRATCARQLWQICAATLLEKHMQFKLSSASHGFSDDARLGLHFRPATAQLSISSEHYVSHY